MKKIFFFAHRQLIVQMTNREISSRYRGSALGLFWSFLNPLLMLFVYTFVFSVVFQAKWSGIVETQQSNFAIILFAGLIIHGFFSEVLLVSVNSITGNSNYVKKVVFPLHVLGVVSTLASLFNLLIGIVLLFLINLVSGGTLHWTIFLVPIVILPLLVLALGVSWLVSAIGVYVRDISQFMGFLTSTLLFMSPVFFSLDVVPPYFQNIIMMNPLTFIIEEFRTVFLWGQLPNFFGLFKYLLVSTLFASLSFMLFDKLKKGFADVL